MKRTMPVGLPRQSSPIARSRRGVLLYFALGLMLVLAIMGGVLFMLARHEELSSEMVFKSEALTAMGESVMEEAFLNITEQLNTKKTENKIYHDVRAASAKEIKIDSDYLKRITPNSRETIWKESEHGIDKDKDIVLKGRIVDIRPFEVKGFTDPKIQDPIEKHGTLELEVTIRWADQDKVIAVSRPFKVVKTVMPVFAECTLFVNNANPDYFGYWPSLYGYNPQKFPETQPSLVLDNGWHGYSKFNKKSDFIRLLETEVLEKGRVPPGRVFINKGIVPLTNGDRASGALQKTFHSGESELLPQQGQFPLKALKEQLARYGLQVSPEPTENTSRTSANGNTSASANSNGSASTIGADGTSLSVGSNGNSNNSNNSNNANARGNSNASDAVPGKGELYVRYIGHGEELKQDKAKLGDKSWDGFGMYFASFIKGAWASSDRKFDAALSGLDLFGRVIEKQKGSATEGEGFFGKILGFLKKITDAVMEKLYSQYSIRVSPTLVYGDVVATYFRAMDYVETGWMDKIKNTFTLNPNQFPLPEFPQGYLDGKAENTPLAKKEDLPADWPDSVKEKWLKLPEDVRKPKFYKILYQLMFPQETYGLPNDFLARVPPGAFFAHYNECLLNFLTPTPDSKIRQFFNDLQKKGAVFLKNEFDIQTGAKAGAFSKLFSLPLSEFNPFLFYVKATDYISSLYDPRNPAKNLFYEKFFNFKDKVYDFKGIIYITGTEDLVLGKAQYRGKAIIITFGRVIFNGPLIKNPDNDKPDDPEANANLTIVSLGGVVFATNARIDAQVYSYIYPPQTTEGCMLNVYGALGTNVLDLDKIRDGGQIVYDYTYHLPADAPAKDRDAYYYVTITNEISRYGYSIRRDISAFRENQ